MRFQGNFALINLVLKFFFDNVFIVELKGIRRLEMDFCERLFAWKIETFLKRNP